MAPEIWKEEYERCYNEKVDTWAVGVIAFKLLVGSYPFPGKTKDQLEEEITGYKINFHNSYYEGLSAPCQEFIKHALNKDPKERFSA
tara:strand:- start:26 stop:286 length:261 start_codon:yes stop_codon:yes gene_type:complete